MRTSKAKPGIHSVLATGRQFSLSQESTAPSHAMLTWECKHRHYEHLPLPPSFPCCIYQARCHLVWDITWVSWGHLGSAVPAVSPLPSICAPPAYSLVGWDEAQERPLDYASAAQQ